MDAALYWGIPATLMVVTLAAAAAPGLQLDKQVSQGLQGISYGVKMCMQSASHVWQHEELRIRALAAVSAGSLVLAIGWLLPRIVVGFLLLHLLAGALLLRSIAARVRERGLLRLLPVATQHKVLHALTHTTLLEVLRDDSLAHHLAPYIPLVLNLNDAEVALYLDSAPVSVRDTLTARGLAHSLPPALTRLLTGTSLQLPDDTAVPAAVSAAATAPVSRGPTWPGHVISAVLRRRAMHSLLVGMDGVGLTGSALTGGALLGSSLLLLRLLMALRARRSPVTKGTIALTVAVATCWLSLLIRSRASASLRDFDALRVAKALQAFESVIRFMGGHDAMRAAAPYLNLWARALGVDAGALWARMGAITGVQELSTEVADASGGGVSDDDASTSMSSRPQVATPLASVTARGAFRQSMTWLAQRRGGDGSGPELTFTQQLQAYLGGSGAGNGIAAMAVTIMLVVAMRRHL